jgi:hypothetical protein
MKLPKIDMVVKACIIETDKYRIAVGAEWVKVNKDDKFFITIKDLRDRLNNKELVIRAYWPKSGDDRLRHWTDMNDNIIKGAEMRSFNQVVVFPVESAGQRGLVHQEFNKWRVIAKEKIKGAPIANIGHSIPPEKKEKVKKVVDNCDLLKVVEKYMKGLKDTSEIGALWKFQQFILKKGENK